MPIKHSYFCYPKCTSAVCANQQCIRALWQTTMHTAAHLTSHVYTYVICIDSYIIDFSNTHVFHPNHDIRIFHAWTDTSVLLVFFMVMDASSFMLFSYHLFNCLYREKHSEQNTANKFNIRYLCTTRPPDLSQHQCDDTSCIQLHKLSYKGSIARPLNLSSHTSIR